jgi:trimeric autotransporter adhesin
MGALNQAVPNPANGTTRISYSLPVGTAHAQLMITDAVGKTIKAISLNGSGSTHVSTTSLSSGVYNYTLYVDGKQVDTKRLVIAR